jgi:hypothetical protein
MIAAEITKIYNRDSFNFVPTPKLQEDSVRVISSE